MLEISSKYNTNKCYTNYYISCEFNNVIVILTYKYIVYFTPMNVVLTIE